MHASKRLNTLRRNLLRCYSDATLAVGLLTGVPTAGFVNSLARPGGNATGFTLFEYSLSGKWLELLKEIASGVTRAAVLRDPAIRTSV
jgi:hypothetical protein